MTFLNATLLFGFLAAGIPVALHLLGRREPKRVIFPAIRFLTQRLETNRRRLQVRRWVLMGMRILLFVLLALALAHPQVHRAAVGNWIGVGSVATLGGVVIALALAALVAGRPKGLRWGLFAIGFTLLLAAGGWGVSVVAGGPQPVQSTSAAAAVAILIDNGPTSGYRIDGDASRLDQAREMATWILSQYPAASRFAFVDRSARPVTFALDATAVQRGLTTAHPIENPRPIAERIEAAVRLLRTSQLPRKTLFVLSDLTQAGWYEDGNIADLPTLAPLIAEDPKVAIQVVDVGSETYHNSFLGPLEIVDATPPRQVATTISMPVGVERRGDGIGPAANQSLTVRLRMHESVAALPAERNGEVTLPPLRTADRQTVSLRDGAGRVELTIPPLETGTYHGTIELVDPDPLAVDNVRYFTVRVAQPRRILIVAEDQREQEVLAAILNPMGIDDPRREYDIEFAKMSTLRDEALGNHAAIGIFDPALPPPFVRDKIGNWVRSGGQLFVALGPALDREAVGAPVDWPLIGSPVRIWRIPEPGTFLQLTQPAHPALSPLASVPGGAPWNAFRVQHYWQVGEANAWSEMMRYAGTEHLALAEQRFDSGRVMMMTTPIPALVPPADQWNDLLALSRTSAWPVVIPLLQQIFEDLSGGLDSEMNVAVGQPVAIGLAEDSSTRFQLFAPNLPPVPLDAAGGVIVPGVPLVAGNYWLRGTEGDRVGFSANLPVESTRLARIDPTVLDDLLGTDAYTIVRDQREIEIAEGESSDARPLYPLIMLIAAAVFMLEQLLSNRFYARPREARSLAAPVAGKPAPVAA